MTTRVRRSIKIPKQHCREDKRQFQKMILDVVQSLPLYPSPYESDTTWISCELAKKYEGELIKMGIIPKWYVKLENEPNRIHYRPREVTEGWIIQDKVLRQLNNLHKEGKIAKKMDYGGEGQGRNYTFIRWGRHAH